MTVMDADKYSILIVDDVSKNIQVVAGILTKERYLVDFAQDGEAALSHAKQKKFDLILLDVMMPGMDGFQVCAELKKDEKTKEIPVIFLTAKADSEAIAKGFTIGGVDYITKPFSKTEMLARVKTHLQLREREKQLSDLNKTKDKLLSIIGHDLKNPFFNIIGLTELLSQSYDEYSREEILDIINTVIISAQQGFDLLENLLTWTRIQTGRITYKVSEFNFTEIAEEVVNLVMVSMRKKKIELVNHIPDNFVMNADPNMTNTILRNLLTNSIKYTPEGGNITIEAGKKGRKEYVIKVIDTGIGISSDRIKDLFTVGSVISTPGTDNEKGTGLGLILCKEFVELQGGNIDVNSKIGKGTEMIIRIPVKK